MTKRIFLAGTILTGLTLGLVGCDNPEAKTEPKMEPSTAKPGPAATPGPVEPSPSPTMPQAGAPSTPATPEEKKDEPKPDDKKDEPKLEAPK